MPLIRKPAETPRAHRQSRADVLKMLVSGSPDERWSAARAAVDAPGATDALAAALRSELDPRVREAIFTSLARIGSKESATTIVRFLRNDDAGLRIGALDALRTLGVAGRELLPDLLNDADSDVRVLSCEVVRSLPGSEATQILCELLRREQEANVCAAAIDVLAEVGDEGALATLAECEEKFSSTPFLVFAIKATIARIHAQSTVRHA